jgi:D-sedoheptulose 7-phosphate isomerase
MKTHEALDSAQHIEAALREAQAALADLLANRTALDGIAQAASAVIQCLEGGGRIFSCGNGGSMCDAMHFAEELTGRFRKDRQAFAATAISDPSHISCVGNDYGYDEIFSRYLEAHARRGDVLVALSTSGSSRNVVRAVEACTSKGGVSISLVGKLSSPLEAISDICIVTPGGSFADRVQELNIKVLHILIELVERHFCPENYAAAAT